MGKSRGLVAQRVSFASVPNKISCNLSGCLTGDVARASQVQASVALRPTKENEEYLKSCSLDYNDKMDMIDSILASISKTLKDKGLSNEDNSVKFELYPKAGSMALLSFKGLEGIPLKSGEGVSGV